MKFPLLLLLSAAAFSFAQWGGGGGKTINDYKKVSISGRDVHVYAPSGLAAKSPLLLSFHGMNQDPGYQQNNTHWEAVADTAGFVVVYPRGGEGYSTWDIGGDKDTKWISEIISQMIKDYDIDPKRVYMSGFSMGGMLSYHAMGKIADKIAAFAPCSGYLMQGAGVAMRPVPIFHTHGTGDDVVGYDGLENNLKSYRQQFNCPAQAEVQENWPHQGDRATLYTWGPCDDGVYIKHLKLQGRGHMPSQNEVSDIWNFVKQFSLDGANITPPIEIPTNRDSVFNGTFSDSLKLAGWNLQQHSGEGSLKFSEGKAEINVTKVGTNAYDVQMIQKGLHYEKGQSYKLTFEAYASVARTLEVNLEKDTDPWTSYIGGGKTFDLGTDKKTYEIVFTMEEPTDEDARISINAGLATGSVFIDNVVLSKASAGDLTGIANKVTVLNVERTYSVYNMKGAFVCKLKGSRMGDVQAQLNALNLEKGLYVVKDGLANRVFSVK
ncbi:carbohydrate binding domain-containing protein [uncultured Fibrobacter sp.]|uniref:carbohydrate binding domain-containing protein n=1 Tax=uncultured Fibrobacter sp. TaxID=261512 RepID=UPI002628E852|nr:carbohydrate binding domain-containing protein [uncultured Fibrobacter sp.]